MAHKCRASFMIIARHERECKTFCTDGNEKFPPHISNQILKSSSFSVPLLMHQNPLTTVTDISGWDTGSSTLWQPHLLVNANEGSTMGEDILRNVEYGMRNSTMYTLQNYRCGMFGYLLAVGTIVNVAMRLFSTR